MYLFLSFRIKPFMWLRPSHRVNSYTILSFTCLSYSNSSISFVTSFFWFQRSTPLVTSFLSFRLLPSVCCQVVYFVASVLTFHLVYTIHWLLLPFRFTSYSPFVTWTLSLHLFPFIRYFLPFVSTLPFHPLRLLMRNCLPFISPLAFHSFLTFVSTLPFHSLWVLARNSLPFVSPLAFHSFLPFVSTLPFHSLWLLMRYCLPFASPLLFVPAFRFNSSLSFDVAFDE